MARFRFIFRWHASRVIGGSYQTCLIAAVLCGLLAFGAGAHTKPAPHIVLWAWQREENLTNIDAKRMQVAFLACNVILKEDRVITKWRDQPLHVSPGTVLIPVVRVDIDRICAPTLSKEQSHALAEVIAKTSHSARSISKIQIDFDALETQRPFYRETLNYLRQRLPENIAISITALASWCIWDSWLRDVPVNETVPMMFSLGRDRDKILRYFRSGGDFRDGRCLESLGISLEDAEVNQVMIPLIKQRSSAVSLYVFTRTSWTTSKLAKLNSLLESR